MDCSSPHSSRSPRAIPYLNESFETSIKDSPESSQIKIRRGSLGDFMTLEKPYASSA